jgi:hypothetical protein
MKRLFRPIIDAPVLAFMIEALLVAVILAAWYHGDLSAAWSVVKTRLWR